jgi:hypothetical protein
MPQHAPAEWERHRATIERIYMREDKSLSDLREIMVFDHGFKATLVHVSLSRDTQPQPFRLTHSVFHCPRKSQYETKLKAWGMVKNLTLAEWKELHWRLEGRRAAKKQTMVVLGDRVLSERRIHKALRRYQGQWPLSLDITSESSSGLANAPFIIPWPLS